MRVNLIYARAANGVIGKNNSMPWHLPEDLAHFRQHTQGCPVIMGRKTWESLPAKFRPLPGRLNVVLTRDAHTAEQLRQQGAVVASNLAQALADCAQLQPVPCEVWVMGGAQIYAQAEPLATRAIVTEIAADYEGDAWAPTLDAADWQERTRNTLVSKTGLPFAFVVYERR